MTATDNADLIDRIAVALMQRRERIGTAESCTGGLIAAACTDLAGSSPVSYTHLTLPTKRIV